MPCKAQCPEKEEVAPSQKDILDEEEDIEEEEHIPLTQGDSFVS